MQDSLSIAGEHIRWARSAGYSARDVVEGLINRRTNPYSEVNWQDALSMVIAYAETMQHIKAEAA